MTVSITFIILAATVYVSYVAFQQTDVFNRFVFNPYTILRRKEWYRFVSCALLHADYMHLAVNMIVFYSFGRYVEREYHAYFGQLGSFYFIGLYVFGAAFANIASYFKHRHNAGYNAVGASGAVSAVTFASIVFSPWGEVLIFGILPLYSLVYGLLYLGVEYYLSWQDRGDHVNHDAHFYGALFGIIYTMICKHGLYDEFIFQITHPPFLSN